jgi:hypothetical protein|tara:strand:- start:202 stop:369 length:168 start_codon:yes stop_codon:yes gene_type:complete
MNTNYKRYEDIPDTDKDYILTVSNVSSITEVSLSDINGFLDMVNSSNGKETNKSL